MEYFWLIWAVAVTCASLIVPLQYRTIKQQVQLVHAGNLPPVSVMVAISMVQTYVLLAIATYAGLWAMPSTGLHLWMLDQTFWIVPVLSGIALGVIVKLVDRHVYQPKMPPKQIKPSHASSRFAGFLVSFYGGVCEEVLMRLGIMTVFVYSAQWLGFGDASYWLGIIVAAIIFGAAHLSMNLSTYGKSSLVIQWTMLLNGMLGILFGWLYWQYGLVAAMISHFSVDIVLHVIMKDEEGKEI